MHEPFRTTQLSLGQPGLTAHGRRSALLRRMAPEHKFATSARLCSEVLAAFAEGALPLDAAGEVLRDALRILASRDIWVRRAGLSCTV